MNLRSKILMTLFALGTIYWGCDSLLYDDLSDCPQGVYVKFYSMTPCQVDSTFIGKVPSITLFAFDENNRLVTSLTQQDVTLSRDFALLMPVSNGYFSFTAWAGLDDRFVRNAFTPGSTTKSDLLFTLKSEAGTAARLNGARLWHGESPVVFLPDPEEYGTAYAHTAVNLGEVTNRIRLIVEFDRKTMQGYDPHKLAAAVTSANGMVRIDGSMPLDAPLLSYPSLETGFDDYTATWDYAMLALRTGYRNNLKITYDGNGKEEIVFDGDLIGSILLRAEEKGVNLACVNDFTIRFLIKDYCAECPNPFDCAVYVNEWLVHSYGAEL